MPCLLPCMLFLTLHSLNASLHAYDVASCALDVEVAKSGCNVSIARGHWSCLFHLHYPLKILNAVRLNYGLGLFLVSEHSTA